MGHREQLLAAARKLLQDKGYAHITARDLVALSGTNLASIGYHFGSKAGLLGAALEVAFDEWSRQLVEAVMADPPPSLLQRTHHAWAALLNSLNGRRSLLVSFMEALAQADRDPELRRHLAGMYRNTRRRAATQIAASLGEGTSPADPRCTALASWMMAVCDGLAIQWLLDPDGPPDGETLLRGLAVLRARPV